MSVCMCMRAINAESESITVMQFCVVLTVDTSKDSDSNQSLTEVALIERSLKVEVKMVHLLNIHFKK